MTKPVKKPSRGKPAAKAPFKKKAGKPTRARSPEARSDSAEERNFPRRGGKPGGKPAGKTFAKGAAKYSRSDSRADSGARSPGRKFDRPEERSHERRDERKFEHRRDERRAAPQARDKRSYAPRTERSSERPYEQRSERRSYNRDERQAPRQNDRHSERQVERQPERSAVSRFDRRKNERQYEARENKRDYAPRDAQRGDRRDERRHEGRSERNYTPRDDRRPAAPVRDERRPAAPRDDKRKLGRGRYAPAEQRSETRTAARPARKPVVKARSAAKAAAAAPAAVPTPTPAPVRKEAGPERIAKRLAHAGIASRRDIERMVAEGRITVNGTVINSPALNVTADDVILVDGNIVGDKPGIRLFRYHKPTGLVTTSKDPQGRPTVFDKMPKEMGRVVSVGRLDLNSEGLLLLTNNGELARHLELPTTGWKRVYRVRVHGTVSPDKLALLAEGIEVDGVKYGAIEAELDAAQDRANVWLTVTLREGKNREIRRVMEAIGLTVNRLLRVSYGPFSLGELPRGAIMEVPKKVLRDQFGKLFEI